MISALGDLQKKLNQLEVEKAEALAKISALENKTTPMVRDIGVSMSRDCPALKTTHDVAVEVTRIETADTTKDVLDKLSMHHLSPCSYS
jgi:hypothetical protein